MKEHVSQCKSVAKPQNIMCVNLTGARVNTIVAPPGGFFTNAEIEQVSLRPSSSDIFRQSYCPSDQTIFLTTGLIQIQAGGALPCTWRVFYRSLASFRWHRAAVPQVRCSHHSSVVITSVPKLRQIKVMSWFMPTGMAVCYLLILWRQLEGLLSSWTSKV